MIPVARMQLKNYMVAFGRNSMRLKIGTCLSVSSQLLFPSHFTILHFCILCVTEQIDYTEPNFLHYMILKKIMLRTAQMT